MLTKQKEYLPLTRNDRTMAITMGKINMLVMKPHKTSAEKILDKVILDHLMLQLLAAPEDMLYSC